jgi:hypothetical protein
MHLSGRGFAAGVYDLVDASGHQTGITLCYNTHARGGFRGFRYRDSQRLYTWEELRSAWSSLVGYAQAEDGLAR